MYRTCLHCHADLGYNSALETFPVGRRIAFDPARGRLWAICRRCGRWNLSPLESRWESLEECERLFRTLRRRVATDTISLARGALGFRLVRIGVDTSAGELAAWRYGRTLVRRRLIRLAPAVTGLGVVSGLTVVGFVAGGLMGGLYVAALASAWAGAFRERPWLGTSRTIRLSDGTSVRLSYSDLRDLRVTPGEGRAPYRIRMRTAEASPPRKFRNRGNRAPQPPAPSTQAERDDLRLARLAVPYLNRYGATPAQVRAATSVLERHEGSAGYLETLGQRRTRAVSLQGPHRLAFEMAMSEDGERIALEGELAALERDWREAEEVARIADRLAWPARLTDAAGDLFRLPRR